MSKRYEFSQSKNDESIVVLSKLIFKFKKRFETVFIINDKNNDVQTFVQKLKFAIKQQIESFSTMSQFFVICYGLFILLVEYVSMDPDSARHASGLAPHTVYSLAGFQSSNHINYYLFNHTLCSFALHISHISYA